MGTDRVWPTASGERSIALDVDPAFSKSRLLCPNVVLVGSEYRLYHYEYGLFMGHEREVLTYALSKDGIDWMPSRTVCMDALIVGAARVLSPYVVKDKGVDWRMYFEARLDGGESVIMNARSSDGIQWQVGSIPCLKDEHKEYGSPCVVNCDDGSWRMYCSQRYGSRHEIVSAHSEDGVTFQLEPGVRIEQDLEYEGCAVYSPHVVPVGNGWRMYYAAWDDSPLRTGRVLVAISLNGLEWTKNTQPFLEPSCAFDANHCSEPFLLSLEGDNHRLMYEAKGQDGFWRIASVHVNHLLR